MMEVVQYSNKGCREENQDFSSWASLDDNSGIFVLADGMGGYEYGDKAAKVVVEAFIEYATQNFSTEEPATLLRDAISYGNDNLMLTKIALGAKKMGCVIVALLLINDQAFITWLGDSRIYMFRDGREVFRTTDHSIVNELVKIKTLRAEDYERFSAIVTKSIMGDELPDDSPIRMIRTLPGDIFVLCSDGFHKEIPLFKAVEFENNIKTELEAEAPMISDNFSFLKISI